MNDDLVSVIIPCFNAEKWIAETLQSVVDQTWTHREIIVVDDGSSDSSRDVVAGFVDAGVRLVIQPNAGPSVARNRGLAEAKGAFVQFLDADDLIESNKIQAQLATLRRSVPDSFVRGPWCRFHDRITARPENHGYFEHDLEPIDALIYKACPQMFIHPGSTLFPRHLLDRAGPWNPDLRMNEDGEYFGRIIAQSQRVVWCPDGFTYYRQHHSGSLSREISRRHFLSRYDSLVLEDELLLSREDSPRVRKALVFRWSGVAYAMWPHYPDLCDKAEARARSFGGFLNMNEGNKLWKVVARFIGWRNVKSIHEYRRNRPVKRKVLAHE